MLSEQFGPQTNVSGLVDTVNITERSGNAEVGTNSAEGLVDVIDVGRLGIQTLLVNTGVINAILLTASDTDLHLEPETERGHTLEVLLANLNILLFGLLGKVQHVRGEEGLAVLLVVRFIGLEHTVEPREEFLGTVIGVHNDGSIRSKLVKNCIRHTRVSHQRSNLGKANLHAVGLGHEPSVVGGTDSADDRCLLLVVGKALAGEVGGTALRDLDDDRGFDVSETRLSLASSLLKRCIVPGGFEDGVDD